MEHWMSVDIPRRHEELHEQAARARIIRMLESGRSTGLRGRLADSAQSMSDVLASFARIMRKDET